MTRKRTDGVRDAYYSRFKPDPSRRNNSTLEGIYLRMLMELASNRFKWVGLPDTIDERFLELTLWQSGLAIFYYDKEFSRYLALRGSGVGRINHYDNPTRFQVIGNSMVSKTLSSSQCVPIWDNKMRLPMHDVAMVYSARLAAVETSLDQNILLTRHPVVIGVDQNEKHSYQQVFDMVKEGDPVILGTPLLGENVNAKMTALQLLPNNTHETMTKLYNIKNSLWNDVMTFLGIKNSDTSKRERMIVDEVESNDEQVLSYRNTALTERRRAAEQINKMFGLAVSVEWNNTVQNVQSIFPGME